MIKILSPYFVHEDERGLITGLAQEGNWKEVNIITSKNGSRRGGHYHKQCVEMFIILSGMVKLHLQSEKDKDRVMTLVVKKGDVFIVPPMIWHTFEILEDSSWINMLSEIVKDDMYKRE